MQVLAEVACEKPERVSEVPEARGLAQPELLVQTPEVEVQNSRVGEGPVLKGLSLWVEQEPLSKVPSPQFAVNERPAVRAAGQLLVEELVPYVLGLIYDVPQWGAGEEVWRILRPLG